MTRQRMLAGLSARERRLEAAGVSTNMIEAGGGPPLLLLNGGIECGAAYWAPAIARLATSWRVLAPDLPGLGESAPLARLEPAEFDRWLRELIGQACEERPSLVAHSLTGSLAMRFAARHPGALRRLLVYASPAVAPYRMPLGLRYVALRFALRPSERNMERFQRFALEDRDRTRAADPGWFDAFTAYTAARARDRRAKQTMRWLLKACARQVPEAELTRIEAPVGLIWGAEDRMTPLALAERAHARLGWPLRAIGGAGHIPHVEAPDAFVRAV